MAAVECLNGRRTDRSKAVVLVLVLLFVALWFILRGDLLYVFPCVIVFLCFSVLLVLRLPRLGKRELILALFVRLFGLCFFWICRFPLPLGVWEGLRVVLVALLGLFSYLFFYLQHCCIFENGVLFMYTLEGVRSVTNFSTAYEVSIKPRLPFSISNVFFVSKGNLLYFYCILQEVTFSNKDDQLSIHRSYGWSSD